MLSKKDLFKVLILSKIYSLREMTTFFPDTRQETALNLCMEERFLQHRGHQNDTTFVTG
jgi:hypothetical protein